MNAEDLIPHSEEAKFLNYPYNDRWTHLKPVIVSLYPDCRDENGEAMTYSKVAAFMKLHYNFHAAESQYKRWFREWGVQKRTLETEKRDIVSALGKRRRPGQSTSNVTIRRGNSDKHIDKKQLVRYVKSEMQAYQNCEIAPGVLTSWCLPYAAWAETVVKQRDQPSPFGTTGQTPSYMNIESPAAITSDNEMNAPSPTMQLVEKERAQYRSSMLLQGQINELLTSLGRDERKIVHNFFHDYYIHSFVTAKFWGKGPRFWSPEMITALLGNGTSQSVQTKSNSTPSLFSIMTETGSQPATNLCNWAIHVKCEEDEESDDNESEVSNKDELFDIQDPESWTQWSKKQRSDLSLTNLMQNSLTNHTFSHISVEDLPISMNMIAGPVSQDPQCLKVDAWKLAIIAGNGDLLWSLYRQTDKKALEDIRTLYPFHLAINFLDGAKSCCGVFEDLNRMFKIDRLEVDNFGHTIVDSLMIKILSSHTDLKPGDVSLEFREMTRFPGEEKDICGRWDIDLPAIRRLFEDGNAQIPVQWKHPFCHTSAQAICHIIIHNWAKGSPGGSSGLFVRYCGNCGLKLTLGHLHTLIIVAASLARNGMAGETLFGAIAVLTCLLKVGFAVLEPFVVSVEDLYGIAEPGRCYHKSMDAFEFINAVPQDVIGKWSSECQIGWKCMVQIFKLAAEVECDEDFAEVACKICGNYVGHCEEPKLGLLWATIQTELLTYRRLDEGMPWVSAHFSMQALERFLEVDGEEFDTPLVKDGMMKSSWQCGDFGDTFWPIAEDVCNHSFMNMTDYSRSSFMLKVELY
ncbi:unnamed protein product [Clonostachys rosea]|uniref:Clr5 domain-containing protein n=1 Tax=Bionectria ochroleuca TaxID=29856 RepID=A0ABY6UNP0_BIOOC|nr:unnamed protein product [Clonostachys rosea]